jgi:hypothetical protein
MAKYSEDAKNYVDLGTALEFCAATPKSNLERGKVKTKNDFLFY